MEPDDEGLLMGYAEDDDHAPLSLSELTELALAADPSAPLSADAVPMAVYLGSIGSGNPPALPGWYMAPVDGHRAGRLGRLVILSLVCAFLIIEAFGLCSTYGQLPFH